ASARRGPVTSPPPRSRSPGSTDPRSLPRPGGSAAPAAMTRPEAWPPEAGSGPAATVAAVSPYTFRRQVARVVLLDGTGAVLLLSGRDPADPVKAPWWEIPGGGID